MPKELLKDELFEAMIEEFKKDEKANNRKERTRVSLKSDGSWTLEPVLQPNKRKRGADKEDSDHSDDDNDDDDDDDSDEEEEGEGETVDKTNDPEQQKKVKPSAGAASSSVPTTKKTIEVIDIDD